jgi:hypothetical protein
LWFGDAYCIRANANANGTYSELTNSAGNHTDNYTYIDDQAGGSDYVEATAADEKDTYGFNMDALPPDTDVSYGVFTVSTYAKSSLAGVDGWNPYIRYAGVDYPGAREALTTGYIGYNQAFATVVGGSTRWTQASLAAAEIGVQFVA